MDYYSQKEHNKFLFLRLRERKRKINREWREREKEREIAKKKYTLNTEFHYTMKNLIYEVKCLNVSTNSCNLQKG